MFLRSLEIKNYRSLEHVELENLEQFNVLIGRNNSGKSSVFGALTLLNGAINSGSGVEHQTIATARDATRSLEFRLLFEPLAEERSEFINLVSPSQSAERKLQLSESPLFRQVEYKFKSFPSTNLLNLQGVRLRAGDNGFATVMHVERNEGDSNMAHYFVQLMELVDSSKDKYVPSQHINLETTPRKGSIGFHTNFGSQTLSFEPAISWLLKRLSTYFQQAFFFNPFRHSHAQMGVSQVELLAQDGSNLAQVLHTLVSNNRERFLEVEAFVHAALPGIGALQTPLTGSSTEVSFRQTTGDYLVRVHEMGGGIEQLLMIATVLLTTTDESTLFLEEPESHLHAGAQRFLIERLSQGSRQVFITTHSPTFINAPSRRSLYQVRISGNRTSITHASNAESLSDTLEDIGSRNSDVLLSDAVMFVEGPGDQKVFELLSEKLGMSLEGHNVTAIPMGGGEYGSRTAAVRTEVLEGISQKAPVPHLFIIDRDEHSESDVKKLRESLGDKFQVLSKRELENYLLVPRALVAAIKSKHADNAPTLERVGATSLEKVETIIRTTADGLYGLVLVKRLRSVIAGLKGGILPPELVTELASQTHRKDFAERLRRGIEARVKKHVTSLKIETLVSKEKRSLDREWAKKDKHLSLAPGEEIITAVFTHFGSNYKKPKDTIRIAAELEADEIDDEIAAVIRKAVELTNRLQST